MKNASHFPYAGEGSVFDAGNQSVLSVLFEDRFVLQGAEQELQPQEQLPFLRLRDTLRKASMTPMTMSARRMKSRTFMHATSAQAEQHTDHTDQQRCAPGYHTLPQDNPDSPPAAKFSSDRGDGGNTWRIQKTEHQQRHCCKRS